MVVSTVFSLLLAESIVRIARPDLKYLVNTQYQKHEHHIFAIPKNHCWLNTHPDTSEIFTIFYNSLALRQSREFSIKKEPGTVRIGVFGDSMTELCQAPVQYVFTEPLDYLLNRSGGSYEVLNFGTCGYGTDQIYLRYMNEAKNMDLDIVIYVFFHNDLREIIQNRLLDVDDQGDLRFIPPPQKVLWKSIASKFYLTYLTIEFYSNFYKNNWDSANAPENTKKRGPEIASLAFLHPSGETNQYTGKAERIFCRLTTEMNKEITKRGGRFYVVFLPDVLEGSINYNRKISAVVRSLGVESLDLSPLFFQANEHHLAARYRFKNDDHWNEEANKLAAAFIFQFLAKKLGIPYDGDVFVKQGLSEYYQAVGMDKVTPFLLAETKVSNEKKEVIASRYLSLQKKMRVCLERCLEKKTDQKAIFNCFYKYTGCSNQSVFLFLMKQQKNSKSPDVF